MISDAQRARIRSLFFAEEALTSSCAQPTLRHAVGQQGSFRLRTDAGLTQ